MRVRAPGKAVLSGAYAVLHGAPAIVVAVDRYVSADTEQPAERVVPEVQAALELLESTAPAPWFDSSELRAEGQKLGLGSSAAIVVASVAALELAAGRADDRELRDHVLDVALRAHHQAQAGGSGIDVAAAVHGGVLECRRSAEVLECEPCPLPAGFMLQLWSCKQPASTRELVNKVHELGVARPKLHEQVLGSLCEASELAVEAARASDADGLVSALSHQLHCFVELGDAAGANIVTSELRELQRLCEPGRNTVLPSGAGGGDISWYAGVKPPSSEWQQRALDLGFEQLDVELGARGLHAI